MLLFILIIVTLLYVILWPTFDISSGKIFYGKGNPSSNARANFRIPNFILKLFK
jgi:hypothetical protein